MPTSQRIIFFANTDWYLYNFRRSLALAAQTSGYEVLLVSPPGDYGERLRSIGLRWESLPMKRRSLNPVRELKVLWHLIWLFRRERPVLVHGFTIKCVLYAAFAASLTGVPARVDAIAGLGYVFSSRDARARLLKPFVKRLLRLAVNGRSERLILQNSDDVALFERTEITDGSHVRLIRGSGVDCMRFKPRAIVKAALTCRPRVLLAARLLWDKGIAEYVEAARILRAHGCVAHFLIAGLPDSGNPAAVPEIEVQRWVSEGVVDWLGHVDDMPALLQSVDVVVLPSYREGLPKSLIEAAACGLPLVTCDTPGCREVVADGIDGLLVPPRDANALARALRSLLDDSALRGRLGAAARVKALAEFDERIVIRETLAVYRELLTQPAL